jgi:di/tricarboxylate transporter
MIRCLDHAPGADLMNLAWLSVGALVAAVTLSCTTTINVGILSMALALAVGVFLGGMTPAAVLRGFPADLLVTLIGVTLLFAIAEVNGTLERLTARAVRRAAATPAHCR